MAAWPWVVAALAFGALLLFSGCSGPDPIERARLAAGRAPTASLPPVPGAGEPYPNLGSVPARPETTPPAARQALAEALVADRANARYVGQPAPPALPRAPEASASRSALLSGGAATILGAAQDEALPLLPPSPPPPPIAGAPRAALEAALPGPQPAPPAPGRVERAPITPITIEPLAPPPPTAMPEEMPARARTLEAAPPPPPPALVSADPPTPLPPAEPRAATTAPAPVPQPPDEMGRASSPSPAEPSVVVDRTALAPGPRAAAAGAGYALGFLPGSATLLPAERAILARLASRGNAAIFQVTGFADAPGEGRALDLPLARARAVAEALREAGVPAERIELGGSARPGPAGRGAEVRLVYTR